MAEYYFEGPEKLLEIWFDGVDGRSSLRNIPRSDLDELMALARCQILSVSSNESMDAYVLSESSMFISDKRFIIKTCGQTGLLATIQPLLRMAKQYGNFNDIENVFYSHKNFQRPELQPPIHQSFDEECATLDEYFKNGAGYCMGRLKQDRWYLYTLNPLPKHITLANNHPDQTLEILMSDLDPEVMSIFTTAASANGHEATKLAGIHELLPHGTLIDPFQFNPCGYSMNALIGEGDHYATIHITPESAFSYVSFETNMPQEEYGKLIAKVLDCFRPGRFTMTFIANPASKAVHRGQQELWKCRQIGADYHRIDCQFLELPGHTVVYGRYLKMLRNE